MIKASRSTTATDKKYNSHIYEKILQEDQYSPKEDPSLEQEEPQHSISNFDQPSKIEMVIEYGNNTTASIMVGPLDDPLTLAKCFCFKYNIDPHIINTLASNIRSLQISSFFNPSSFKIQKNSPIFDDKENNNKSNIMNRSRSKSNQKTNQSSKVRKSRNKTNQSNLNQSTTVQFNTLNSTNRDSVFDRLYKDSKKKYYTRGDEQIHSKRSEGGSRMSLNTTNNNNKSLNQSSIQSCLQIYQKNTKIKEQVKRHSQLQYQKKQQKQLQKCSFKPKINPLSNLIAEKLREIDESSILNKSTNDKQMLKIKEYLLNREQQQMRQCTFKPKIITKISNSAVSTSSTQRCLQLHHQFQLREVKKKLMGEEIHNKNQKQHHPQINNISKIIVHKNFFQRLEEDQQKRIQKKQSLEKLQQRKQSQSRPSTGRPPANRNLGEKTVGQYLYEMSRASRALATKEPPRVLANSNSHQIYLKSKQLAFQYIFQLLDSDRDGLISSTKINISALSEEVLRLVSPLLSQMEEVGVELNNQEFSMAFERLYSTFSVGQKNIIIKVYKSKQMGSRTSENPNFTPALNENSLKIARQLCSQDIDIYQNSMQRIRQKQNKLNRMRAEKMLQDFSECTFHPRIHN